MISWKDYCSLDWRIFERHFVSWLDLPYHTQAHPSTYPNLFSFGVFCRIISADQGGSEKTSVGHDCVTHKRKSHVYLTIFKSGLAANQQSLMSSAHRWQKRRELWKAKDDRKVLLHEAISRGNTVSYRAMKDARRRQNWKIDNNPFTSANFRNHLVTSPTAH
jgi:hypothetical protein